MRPGPGDPNDVLVEAAVDYGPLLMEEVPHHDSYVSIRVVVATANLTKGGWTCTRNHLWQQEFPARTDADADADWLRLLPDGGFASELACLVASLMVRPRH